jgi:hypothetical protein
MTKGWTCCAAIAAIIDTALNLGDMLNKNVSPQFINNLVSQWHE